MKNLITIFLLLLSISAFCQSRNFKNDTYRVTLENHIDDGFPFGHNRDKIDKKLEPVWVDSLRNANTSPSIKGCLMENYVKKTVIVLTFEVNSREERRKVDEFILSLSKEYIAIWPFIIQDAAMRTFYGKCQILKTTK